MARSKGDFSTTSSVSRERQKQITAWLTDRTTSFPPLSDRATWTALGNTKAFQHVLKRADDTLKQPIPKTTDELYLDFSRTGTRVNWERVASGRRGRISTFTLAECVENKGRFIPALNETIRELCSERVWVMPAHDRDLAVFHGEKKSVDLASSVLAWDLAATDYLFGEKLDPSVRRLLKSSVRQRVIQPYLDMVRGDYKPDHWLTTTNNWNAVCLAGVTGAGLIEADSKAEQAELIAAAEHYIKFFLSGFTPDGYCSEGLGYWNYGFRNFVSLSETLSAVTGGKLDLLADPAALAPSRFGSNIQIMNGVSPAFADCSVTAQPGGPLMRLLDLKFGRTSGVYPTDDAGTNIAEALIYTSTSDKPTSSAPALGLDIHTWFKDAGILIGRPEKGSSCLIGVALKGGNNNENHNHNDIGSYVVVRDKSPVLVDPGPETYTARTFSARRYESKLLNSFGHAVPVVGGQLQRPGADAKARVLEATLTTDTDTLRLDIASAYTSCSELKKLERSFVYDRRSSGSLVVSDHVNFSSPQTFETPLVSLNKFVQEGPDKLVAEDSGEKLHISIDTGGVPFTLAQEQIVEQAHAKPWRMAIKLQQPVTSATVTVTIKP